MTNTVVSDKSVKIVPKTLLLSTTFSISLSLTEDNAVRQIPSKNPTEILKIYYQNDLKVVLHEILEIIGRILTGL